MADFYIKRMTITGPDKEPAVVEFTKGLNIVFGPSDTGKSYIVECIDYLFGADKIRFDEKTGYDTFILLVESEQGNLTLERKLGKTIITVVSSRKDIASGEYTSNWRKGSKRDDISDIWLRLMGIRENHEIIKNGRRVKIRLTVRLFSHIFLIKEESILQKQSIIMPIQNVVESAAFASLYFLITGEDFADSTPQEEKKIREARKKAVIAYINAQLSDFAEMKNSLAKVPSVGIEDLQVQVDRMVDELDETEKQITTAIGRSKLLMQEVYELSNELSECNNLSSQFQALHSQYYTDIRRLEFIVDGEAQRHGLEKNDICPYCENRINPRKEKSYTGASKATLVKIQGQVEELQLAQTDLTAKRSNIERQIEVLVNEKTGVDDLINRQLRPKAQTLKQSLREYCAIIEIRKEASVIDRLETSLKADLFAKTTEEEEKDAVFSIKKHYDATFFRSMDTYLNKILEASQYLNMSTAYLGHTDFDLVINGQAKATHGKGFRAFQNTVLALALLEYLTTEGEYSPSMLIVDSPIQSLEEGVDDKTPDTMKAGLLKYLIDNQSYGQVIIIENKIPPALDYSNVNMIEFTKGKKPGRYGLLYGVQS